MDHLSTITIPAISAQLMARIAAYHVARNAANAAYTEKHGLKASEMTLEHAAYFLMLHGLEAWEKTERHV